MLQVIKKKANKNEYAINVPREIDNAALIELGINVYVTSISNREAINSMAYEHVVTKGLC